MSSPRLLVHLPSNSAHLANRVLQAGAIPVVDATTEHVTVPAGAWVRTRPGRPAPGKGPVILAELGAPIPGRETWLETTFPRDPPPGYAGLILKGKEAGGFCGDEDGLVALARCPSPHRILLDAGLGPATAAAAAALGAAGVVVVEQHLACKELNLSKRKLARLSLPADELTAVISGFRVANAPTSKVALKLVNGLDIWEDTGDDLQTNLWPMGEGLALAADLAKRHNNLTGVIEAYLAAMENVGNQQRLVKGAPRGPLARSASELGPKNAVATTGGSLGCGVLWQLARWSGRAIHGGPVPAMMAVGCAIMGDEEQIKEQLQSLPAPATMPPISELTSPPQHHEAIAIIGLGCRLPGADHPEEFWSNIITKRSAITEVPSQFWSKAHHHDTNRTTVDKTYCSIGGFLGTVSFSPKEFRIPPRVAEQIDPVQQLALVTVADALKDARLKVRANDTNGRVFDRERTAVILGNSHGGEIKDRYAIRLHWPKIQEILLNSEPIRSLEPAKQRTVLAELRLQYIEDLPRIDQDSMPGELANVIAGRVANAFDLGGENYIVDAACASSMAAVQASVKSLRDHESDLVITGGADRSMGVPSFVKFSKIGALSPDHSAPFDKSANGFVMGEGAAILVLKRLSDAVADKDTIYAVIRGIGASSDGKGKGITAPSLKGQLRALSRAYKHAGIEPHEVDLIEAHGTSTVVGDRVEVQALEAIIGPGKRHQRGPIRLGSVKSMIGHLKSAAGAASLLKTTLALHKGILPPTLNFKEASPQLPLSTVPLQVQNEAEPWANEGIRRAGVSAFGFGGTNFHVVLESWAGQPVASSLPRRPPKPQQTPLPDGIWAASSQTKEGLIAELSRAQPSFNSTDTFRIAAYAATDAVVAEQRSRAIDVLSKDRSPALLAAKSIHFQEGPISTGKTALLFTGQGSQYLEMVLDLAKTEPIVAATLAEAEEVLAPLLDVRLSELLNPTINKDSATKRLTQTEYSQPATLAVDVALFRLLRAYGVGFDYCAGHSLGEYAAAVAAGVFSFPKALTAVTARGREMSHIELEDCGKMVSVSGDEDTITPHLKTELGIVMCANLNAPNQTVVAGHTLAVDEVVKRLQKIGLRCQTLPVSHAFHTSLMAPASEPLKNILRQLGLHPPVKKLWSNVTGAPYPEETEQIIELLGKQIAAPVRFRSVVEDLYKQGATRFIEVGPKRALWSFTRGILKDQPHEALYTNHPKDGGVPSFRSTLAALVVAGAPVRAMPMAEPSSAFQSAPRMEPAPSLSQSAQKPPSSGPSMSNDLEDRLLEALRPTVRAAISDLVKPLPISEPAKPTIVVTGASVGLPGGRQVFDANNFQAILNGENRIDKLHERSEAFLSLNLVRLKKDPTTGQGSFHAVESTEDVIRLAGQKRGFDLGDWGISAERQRTLDITTELAIAAAYEALRDAGLPLVEERVGAKRTIWRLPKEIGDETGVIFASAFPGYDQLLKKVQSNGDDGSGKFDRRLLFQILSMGHSQLAEFIGARGPNTALNAACASSTQAIILASDWITLGRCKRVIVVGADDVTNEQLLPWIGGGFMAAGAATTEGEVEDAALPFDRRRHGLILGMGAVGVVVEDQHSAQQRGVQGIATLVSSRLANSAFHGSKLDSEHISSEMSALVKQASVELNTPVSALAKSTIFFSHETFTPARGGSAASEIAALNTSFGDSSHEIYIVNTKGFTGHAMGAGLEDAIAIKALESGKIPPVPNFREPDPALGDLKLSTGEFADFQYAIRLAAGFGSQVALTFWKRNPLNTSRVNEAVRAQWAQRILSTSDVEEFVVNNTLRLRPSSSTQLIDLPVLQIDPEQDTPTDEMAPPMGISRARAAEAITVVPTSQRIGGTDVLDEVFNLIADATGYDLDDLDANYTMEADLGIDTVKQAEIFSAIAEAYSLPTDALPASASLTIGELANAVAATIGGPSTHQAQSQVTPKTEESLSPLAVAAPAPPHETQPLTETVLQVICEATGYSKEDLSAEYELEADLGIDTVKQAEILSTLTADLGVDTEAFQGQAVRTISDLISALEPFVSGLPTKPILQGSPTPELAAPAPPISIVPNPAPQLKAVVASHPPVPRPNPESTTSTKVLQIIAEATGYDLTDLAMGDELEADLGIDTVKQAEILSSLEESFGGSFSQEQQLPQPLTVQGIINAVGSDSGPPTPPESPTKEQPKPTPAKISFEGLPALRTIGDPAETLAIVLDVVADKTGYDLTDLDPDFELEADLGIDTVKQAEIYSATLQRLGRPADAGGAMPNPATIRSVAAALHEPNFPVGVEQVDVGLPHSHPPSARLPWGQEAERPTLLHHSDQTVLTNPDSNQRALVVTPLPPGFSIRRPVLLKRSAHFDGQNQLQTVKLLGDAPLQATLERVLTEQGFVLVNDNPEIILDLSGDAKRMLQRAQTYGAVRQWITLTRLGGLVGQKRSTATSLQFGARAGFTKALFREWHGVGQVLDLHPDLDHSTACDAIARELGSFSDMEVFIDEVGQRSVVTYEVVDRPPPGNEPLSGVIVATGGARGITAACCRELARRYDATFAVVGRVAPLSAPLDVKAAKVEIRQRLKESQEVVKPIDIQRELSKLKRADEARLNLKRLRELGAQVHYFCADLSNLTEVRDLVARVTDNLGEIGLVLHGAGVERSGRLEDKTPEGFDLVFSGKALGGAALFDAVDDTTYCVTMGSVAGRFGNAGQVDYAAANDALARVAHSRANTLHLDWTAWDEIGMAAGSSMKRLLEKSGVTLLPAAAGASVLTDLISQRFQGEYIVAGSLGQMEKQAPHPLLDRLNNGKDQVEAYRDLSVATDPWLQDHCIDGVFVLPGVVGMELMTATASHLFPEQTYVGCRNVRFTSPVKVHGDRTTRLHLIAARLDDNESEVRLIGERTLRTGKIRRTEHFRGVMRFGEPMLTENLPSAFLPDEPYSREEVYKRFFHGPRFQVIDEVLSVSQDGILAQATVDETAIADNLLTAPGVFEAAFQLAGFHHLLLEAHIGLPAEVEHLALYSQPTREDTLIITAKTHNGSYDIDVDGPRGPVARVRGFRLVDTGPVPPEDRIEPPEHSRPTCFTPPTTSGAASHSDSHDQWLSSGEVRTLRSRGNRKRVQDRIAGRVAAKRALHALTGAPAENIRVENLASGQPVAIVAGEHGLKISLSHSAGLAVARASRSGHLGVDLERIEARSQAFTKLWFTGSERSRFAQEPLLATLTWAVKEAVVKALGTGFRLHPTLIEVTNISLDGGATIHLYGKAREKYLQLGAGSWSIEWTQRSDNMVVVVAQLAA